jgi:hypothetical protein
MMLRYLLMFFCLIPFVSGCLEGLEDNAYAALAKQNKEEHGVLAAVAVCNQTKGHNFAAARFGGRIILGITGEPSNLIPPSGYR